MEQNTLILEKGVEEKVLDVTVDDAVYDMQDRYELPYTTIDDNGNTVVSVVEKVEIATPTEEFPERDFMQVRLHVKIFKNETIAVEPVTASPNEIDPRKKDFLSATITALKHHKGSDLYMNQIYEKITTTYNGTTYEGTPTRPFPSPISSLRYTIKQPPSISNPTGYAIYDDDSEMATSSTTGTTYLYPHFIKNHTTSATTYYNKWIAKEDRIYFRHLNYWYGKNEVRPEVRPISDFIKEIIQKRQAPNIIVRHSSLRRTTDIREIRARQTLKRLIGENAFEKYIVRGFITFKGESGRTYQIFPGHGKVAVWQKGVQIEQLCVILTGDFPPTDSVIMRLLLIQESEDRFKKFANVFPAYAPGLNRKAHVEVSNQRLSLPEIFADLKSNKEAVKKLLVA